MSALQRKNKVFAREALLTRATNIVLTFVLVIGAGYTGSHAQKIEVPPELNLSVVPPSNPNFGLIPPWGYYSRRVDGHAEIIQYEERFTVQQRHFGSSCDPRNSAAYTTMSLRDFEAAIAIAKTGVVVLTGGVALPVAVAETVLEHAVGTIVNEFVGPAVYGKRLDKNRTLLRIGGFNCPLVHNVPRGIVPPPPLGFVAPGADIVPYKIVVEKTR